MLGHDMIVITGAGGHVGGLIARLLSERGERTRLLTRDPSRVPALQGAEVVRVDGFEDEDALDASLHEGDRVFMVAMHSSPEDRVRQHQAFVDAAVRAGVGRLVYLSCLECRPGRRVPPRALARRHRGDGPGAPASHARSSV